MSKSVNTPSINLRTPEEIDKLFPNPVSLNEILEHKNFKLLPEDEQRMLRLYTVVEKMANVKMFFDKNIDKDD